MAILIALAIALLFWLVFIRVTMNSHQRRKERRAIDRWTAHLWHRTMVHEPADEELRPIAQRIAVASSMAVGDVMVAARSALAAMRNAHRPT